MSQRKAQAVWNGTLREGQGTMRLGSGAFEGRYSFASRFEEGAGTNPEELIGAALAGCYAMALSGDLGKAGHTPKSIDVAADVTLDRVDGRPTITRIALTCQADVPGIDEATLRQIAEGTRTGCPVSRALKAVEITVDARLAGRTA